MVFFSLIFLQEVPDENYDLPYNQTETNGDAVMIKMDVPNREEPSFPKEKWKTLIGKWVTYFPVRSPIRSYISFGYLQTIWNEEIEEKINFFPGKFSSTQITMT